MKYTSRQRVLDVMFRLLEGEQFTFNSWEDFYGIEGEKEKARRRKFQRDLAEIRTVLDVPGSKTQLVSQMQNSSFSKRHAVYHVKNKTSAEDKFTYAVTIAQIILGSRALIKKERDQLLDYLSENMDRAQKEKFTEYLKIPKYGYIELYEKTALFKKISACTQAIISRNILKFAYKNANSEITIHEAQPEILYFDTHFFYIVMQHAGQKNVRVYRLDRIDKIIKEEAGNTKRDANHYNLQDQRKEAYLIPLGNPITFKFKCRISVLTALNNFPISEVIHTEKNADPIIKVTAREDGALLWLLSQGNNVQVIEPISLVRKIREILKKSLEQYED